MIRNITIVTQCSAKTYSLGDSLNGVELTMIIKDTLSFTGDPFDHYIGLSANGDILFSVNCLVPCVVEYETGCKK